MVVGSIPTVGVYFIHISYKIIRDGVVGNISACHADARGSIPRRGVPKNNICFCRDTLAEWLRRQPAKLLHSVCEGSNPSGVDILFCWKPMIC